MEYCYCHQCGVRLRNDDRPQDSEWTCAINHSCFIQFARQGHEILTQEENIVRIGKESGNDQGKPVCPASNFLEEGKGWGNGCRSRQEKGPNEPEKQKNPSG